MPKHIVIDVRRLGDFGIGTYIRNLVQSLARLDKENRYTLITFHKGAGELEGLLQVLNDVRVGNWLAAGSPDPEQEKKMRRDKKSLQHMMLMELAGGFEMLFLGSLSGMLEPGDEQP